MGMVKSSLLILAYTASQTNALCHLTGDPLKIDGSEECILAVPGVAEECCAADCTIRQFNFDTYNDNILANINIAMSGLTAVPVDVTALVTELKAAFGPTVAWDDTLPFTANVCDVRSPAARDNRDDLIQAYAKAHALKAQAAAEAAALTAAGDLDNTQTATNTAAWQLYADTEDQKMSDADKALWEAADAAQAVDSKIAAAKAEAINDASTAATAAIAAAKSEAINEAHNHVDNFKKSDHDYSHGMIQMQMQSNYNTAKAESDKAASSATECKNSAKDAERSAHDAEHSADDAKKSEDAAAGILASVKTLVSGWLSHSHGCGSPPCASAQPCQYSSMNPMYYYHC